MYITIFFFCTNVGEKLLHALENKKKSRYLQAFLNYRRKTSKKKVVLGIILFEKNVMKVIIAFHQPRTIWRFFLFFSFFEPKCLQNNRTDQLRSMLFSEILNLPRPLKLYAKVSSFIRQKKRERNDFPRILRWSGPITLVIIKDINGE